MISHRSNQKLHNENQNIKAIDKTSHIYRKQTPPLFRIKAENLSPNQIAKTDDLVDDLTEEMKNFCPFETFNRMHRIKPATDYNLLQILLKSWGHNLFC